MGIPMEALKRALPYLIAALIFIILLFSLSLTVSCTETEEVASTGQSCPSTTIVSEPYLVPRTPQCPFGQPVHSYDPPYSKIGGTSLGVVVRDHYSIGYSYWFNNALWACETMTSAELVGTAKRKSSFALDPLLSKYLHTKSSAYTNSGYDRAHLISASNHLWSQRHMDETFYMTNVAPMRPSFNRGIWRQFEKWVRDWVLSHGDAYVITGAVFQASTKYDHGFMYLHGDIDNTYVPSHFYKILVSKRGTTSWHAIAFIFDHEGRHIAPYSWRNYVVAISTLEGLTDINFMPSLSSGNRVRMETKVPNFDLWAK